MVDRPRNSTITAAPKIAGPIVIANEPPPGITPRYSPTPSITRVIMYTAYKITVNATSRQPTVRGRNGPAHQCSRAFCVSHELAEPQEYVLVTREPAGAAGLEDGSEALEP